MFQKTFYITESETQIHVQTGTELTSHTELFAKSLFIGYFICMEDRKCVCGRERQRERKKRKTERVINCV